MRSRPIYADDEDFRHSQCQIADKSELRLRHLKRSIYPNVDLSIGSPLSIDKSPFRCRPLSADYMPIEIPVGFPSQDVAQIGRFRIFNWRTC